MNVAPAAFGLLGYPLEHSLSPVLHDCAYRSLGLDWSYELLPQPDEFSCMRQLGALTAGDFRGFNVTTPYKSFLLRFCPTLDAAARCAGGVNVLYLYDDELCGCNTDGQGAVAALRHAGFEVGDKRILLCGTGATAASIAAALLLDSPSASVCLLSREQGRSQALVERLEVLLPLSSVPITRTSLQAASYERALEFMERADFIINATTLGMHDGDPSPLPAAGLQPRHVVLDAVYRSRSRLQQDAASAGCNLVDGRSMLMEQALASILIWARELECEPAPDQVALARHAMSAIIFPPTKGEC
ncbi:MAG: hypothetical protein IJH83_03250 [Coriobacteriales bacterium]|nr:hypothetical protein [Coriobacteriales bacterium]